MKNEINAVLENMTTTIPEPEDFFLSTLILLPYFSLLFASFFYNSSVGYKIDNRRVLFI